MRQKIKIFKDIEGLDAQIRSILNPDDKDPKEDYFIVEVGLCESLGEQGYNYTFFYDSKPEESEIIADIKAHIKEEFGHLKEKILSAREERYKESFRKLGLFEEVISK